jgi:hypothetical protein
MSFILTFPSSSAGTSSLASTTSAIALSDILTGAVIALGGLIFLLVLNELKRHSDSWNAKKAAVLQAFLLPLTVTFCALVAFKTAQVL